VPQSRQTGTFMGVAQQARDGVSRRHCNDDEVTAEWMIGGN